MSKIISDNSYNKNQILISTKDRNFEEEKNNIIKNLKTVITL